MWTCKKVRKNLFVFLYCVFIMIKKFKTTLKFLSLGFPYIWYSKIRKLQQNNKMFATGAPKFLVFYFLKCQSLAKTCLSLFLILCCSMILKSSQPNKHLSYVFQIFCYSAVSILLKLGKNFSSMSFYLLLCYSMILKMPQINEEIRHWYSLL